MFKFIKKFLYNYLLAFDQFTNTLLLGHPDETISSRLGRTKGRERYKWVKYLRMIVNLLFLPIEKDHCENAVHQYEQLNFEKYDYELWSWIKKDGKDSKKN